MSEDNKKKAFILLWFFAVIGLCLYYEDYKHAQIASIGFLGGWAIAEWKNKYGQ